MKILSFGYDTNLLLPEDETNENQYRQRRYCELLDQEKVFVILSPCFPHQENFLANRRIWATSVSTKLKLQQVCLACWHGMRIGRQFQPDVVEYQDPQLAGLIAYLIAKRLNVPLIGAVFNDFLDNPVWLREEAIRRFYNRIGKFVLSHSIRVRCDSAETTRSLNNKGFTQVSHIPFFVPWLEKFLVSDEIRHARLKCWDDNPVILCVARLSEEKNIALLLRAFRQVCNGSQRGRLVIVGSGSLKDELEHLSVDLGIAHRISWVGKVDYVSVPRYYREANLFVLSSNSESSARVLIQAQAAQLPTLTTDTSGSRDIVSDGRTGYVTPVGDVGALAKALNHLLGDKATYQRMLESNEYHALEQYGESVITTQLRDFYSNLTS